MDAWRETVGAALSANVYFGAVASIFCYGVGVYLQKRYRFILFNPILIGIILVVVLLKVFRIDFASYDEGASHLNYLLTPATVALAIPLYKQFEALKRNWKVTLASICVGVLTNCAVVYITAKLFDLERVYYVTCLTKSITTAIGMGVTEELGGDVTIAVVMIILSGICGAVFGEKTLKLFHVTDPMAQGLAIGTASHAIGTSKALEMGETVGASSGLAIVVTGVLTVVLAPFFAGLID